MGTKVKTTNDADNVKPSTSSVTMHELLAKVVASEARAEHLQEQLDRYQNQTCSARVSSPTPTRAEELTQKLQGLNDDIIRLIQRQRELEQDLIACREQLAVHRLLHCENSAALKELLSQPTTV